MIAQTPLSDRWSYAIFPQVTTTASFVDVPLADAFGVASTTVAWFKPWYRDTTFVVVNTGGTNGVSFQVVGSCDGTDFSAVAIASANVALSTTATVSLSNYWPWLKLQVKDQVGAAHTTVKAMASAYAT